VKIFGTKNCHDHEISERMWYERLKMSCKNQLFKKINLLKIVCPKVLARDSSIIELTNNDIFAMSILYIPHVD